MVCLPLPPTLPAFTCRSVLQGELSLLGRPLAGTWEWLLRSSVIVNPKYEGWPLFGMTQVVKPLAPFFPPYLWSNLHIPYRYNRSTIDY
jgi:hypothetical protein